METLVCAFCDRKLAGTESDCFPCVQSLCIIDFQYQSGQAAKRPRAKTYWDFRSEPRFEITSPPMACRPLALIPNNVFLVGMQRPFLLAGRFRVIAVIFFQIAGHPRIECLLPVFRKNLCVLVFTPDIPSASDGSQIGYPRSG